MGQGGGALRQALLTSLVYWLLRSLPAGFLARSYKGMTLARLASMSAMRELPEGWVDNHSGGAPLLLAAIFCHKLPPARGS